MSIVLAIDTSTEACSVALALPGEVRERHELLPRAHNRHILAMVKEVLREAPLSSVDQFVCGVGPGSFTGLRIGVSVAQGLAWSTSRLIVPVCSLTAQAWSALNILAEDTRWLLSATDAQIGQLYWRWFRVDAGQLKPCGEPKISLPNEISPPDGPGSVAVVGSGCHYEGELPMSDHVVTCYPDCRPHAALMAQHVQSENLEFQALAPEQLLPRYVQTDIGWKKLSEQPRRD